MSSLWIFPLSCHGGIVTSAPAAVHAASSHGNNLAHKCVTSSSSAEVGWKLAAAGPAERGERFWP